MISLTKILVLVLLLLGASLLATAGSAFNCASLTNRSACPFSSGSCNQQIITVPVSTMNANFTADNRSGNAPLTVQFYDSSFGMPTGWLWDFGDGTTSGERHPKHTYDTAGKYNVTLTISQNHGDKNGTVWSWTVMTYESTKLEPGYITVAGVPETRVVAGSQRSSALAGVMAGKTAAGYPSLKTASRFKKVQ